MVVLWVRSCMGVGVAVTVLGVEPGRRSRCHPGRTGPAPPRPGQRRRRASPPAPAAARRPRRCARADTVVPEPRRNQRHPLRAEPQARSTPASRSGSPPTNATSTQRGSRTGAPAGHPEQFRIVERFGSRRGDQHRAGRVGAGARRRGAPRRAATRRGVPRCRTDRRARALVAGGGEPRSAGRSPRSAPGPARGSSAPRTPPGRRPHATVTTALQARPAAAGERSAPG